MEIISYVKWTKPGEYSRFCDLIATTKDNTELRTKIMQEFNVDNVTANLVILRYRDKINKYRSK